ncbi:MAG: YceI family protein [Candidatus Velthaea sp.]
MRTGAFWFVFAVLFAALPAAAFADEAHAIDVQHSRAAFTVSHVLVQRVGGTLPIRSGTVTLGADGRPSAVEAVLDPKRIDTRDEDRDGDLQSADWFDTARFPTWIFKSTRIEPLPGAAFKIVGVLTIHGQSVPVVLDAQMTGTAAKRAYIASAHVDRHAFGMARTTYDALVGTDIAITLTVETR